MHYNNIEHIDTINSMEPGDSKFIEYKGLVIFFNWFEINTLCLSDGEGRRCAEMTKPDITKYMEILDLYKKAFSEGVLYDDAVHVLEF